MLNFNWHYHPEFEITLIIEGKGQCFVGDNIFDYNGTDLIMIGPSTPHAFASDMRVPESKFMSIIIQFSKSSIGLENLKERGLYPVHLLFQRSASGIRFPKNIALQAYNKMDLIPTDSCLLKVIDLLYIIDILAKADKYQVLSKNSHSSLLQNEDSLLIEKVCYYIFQNFEKDISLTDSAKIANLTVPTFCRFFKKHLGITYISYLKKLKIASACKYLIQTDMTINSICYRTGFNNLSNFNRCFMDEKKVTPRTYRNQYKK